MGAGSIEPKKLAALMGTAIDAREQIREIQDEVNRDTKAAALQHGLHPGAFAMCLRISKLDQVKRIALLNAFDEYRHVLGLDDAPQVELLPEPPTQMRQANGQEPA